MNWEAVGAMGEVVGALAVVVTLVYLAIQIRQNTNALRSSTFQQISASTSLTAEAQAMSPDLASIIVKASEDPSTMSPSDWIRFNNLMIMTFRRYEAAYIQRLYGAIDKEMSDGFERSALSMILNGSGKAWWESAQPAFSDTFVLHVNDIQMSGQFQAIHPGFKSGSEED